MIKKSETLLRAKIRSILQEAFPGFSADPAVRRFRKEMEEDEREEQEQEKARKYTTFKQLEGEPLETIAKEVGVSKERVRQLVPLAMERFKDLHPDAEGPATKELEDTVSLAVEDYIDYLKGSGELSLQDVWLLRSHPELIADLDEFRDKFLPKYLDSLIKKTKTQKLMKSKVK
jgi:hypothetical protein